MDTLEEKDRQLSLDLSLRLEENLFKLLQSFLNVGDKEIETSNNIGKLPGTSNFEQRIMRKRKKFDKPLQESDPRIDLIKSKVKKEMQNDLKRPLKILLDNLDETTEKYSIILYLSYNYNQIQKAYLKGILSHNVFNEDSARIFHSIIDLVDHLSSEDLKPI